jgi:hypothetical protein
MQERYPMYCPKCGQQQALPTVRFCTRCGFPLVSVTQLLAEDDAAAAENRTAQKLQLRRPDLNLGAALMFLGALFSLFVSVYFGSRDEGGPFGNFFSFYASVIWGVISNAVIFAVLLLGFRFTARQRDLSMGATLMFLCSLLTSFLMPAAEIFETTSLKTLWLAELAIETVCFVLLLFFAQGLLQRSMLLILKLFLADDAPSTSGQGRSGGAELLSAPQTFLPAHETAVMSVPTLGGTTDRMVQPQTITEQTTSLLKAENKA